MNKWLSFYHPSTAVFVDDQQSFLKALQFRLSPKMPAQFFNNPLIALESIKTHQSQYDNLKQVFTIQETQEVETDSYMVLRLEEICKTSTNLDRFNEKSVVIVDYMMPEMDGISFCRLLKNHPIKKIMLTANEDYSMATRAFNEGIIDYFIIKDSPNFVELLNQAIESMQKAYFHSLMGNSFNALLQEMVPFLNSEQITQFYKSKMKELDACEHYLLDRQGSMLFITKAGIPITLAISTDKDMETYAAIALDNDEQKIGIALSSKEKLLHFPKKTDEMEPVSSWNSFLFDALPFPNHQGTYYSLIHDQNL